MRKYTSFSLGQILALLLVGGMLGIPLVAVVSWLISNDDLVTIYAYSVVGLLILFSLFDGVARFLGQTIIPHWRFLCRPLVLTVILTVAPIGGCLYGSYAYHIFRFFESRETTLGLFWQGAENDGTISESRNFSGKVVYRVDSAAQGGFLLLFRFALMCGFILFVFIIVFVLPAVLVFILCETIAGRVLMAFRMIRGDPIVLERVLVLVYVSSIVGVVFYWWRHTSM